MASSGLSRPQRPDGLDGRSGGFSQTANTEYTQVARHAASSLNSLSVVATYYGTRSSSTSKQALYSIKEIDREGACLVRVAVLSAAMLRPEAAAAPAP